ncbi:hypothetical protein [Rhizobium tumorigenes]|uniref:Uncharacterized protein n=1 Tax=Rhizobium tumorigenes TaxID=2041385 RepID=A0AAF1KT80_9HYPH|nr:hypothetical protein [Rhizobium tumorigenes]WFR96865.1 hypothetical protein PR017_07060 [Rhizobium tumorigenes]
MSTAKVRDIFQTPTEVIDTTGMAMDVGVIVTDPDVFMFSVVNTARELAGYATLSRAEVTRLRDALTRELEAGDR